MFLGEYHHQLDEKGRFRIPAKYRAQLGENPVMICGSSHCIMLMPKAEFDKLVEQLFGDLDIRDAVTTDLQRRIFSSAQEVEEDKQKRVTLSAPLVDHSHITKNIVTIGVMNRLELWDEDVYKEHMAGLADLDAILNAALSPKRKE